MGASVAAPTVSSCRNTCSKVKRNLSPHAYSAAESAQYAQDKRAVQETWKCFRQPKETELMCTAVMVKRTPNERSFWSCTEGAKTNLKRCVEANSNYQSTRQFQACL